jgi:hypothetical protein
MATEKQITANRANAQHTHGPKTPEGKAKSSQNALKTGLYAKSRVIRSENPEEYDELVAEYYRKFPPASPDERFLLDRLINAEWLHRRVNNAETAVWELYLDSRQGNTFGGVYLNHAEILSRIQRRIDANERNFDKARKELLTAQANRPAETVESLETAEPLPNRDCEGAAAESPKPAQDHAAHDTSKPLNPKLASFRPTASEPAEATAKTPNANPKPEDNPPLAA